MVYQTGYFHMRYSATRSQRGFTLIEMMIIAPVVILLIGAFVVFTVSLTGSSLRLREQNTMSYDIQNALNTIEDDATLAMAFSSTTVSGTSGTSYSINTPQGNNNGSGATGVFTASASGPLLVKSAATTTNPSVSNRSLVYYAQPDATCTSGTLVANDPYPVLYVYFVRSNTLWRRVILGTVNSGGYPALCNGPAWQKASCDPSLVGSYPSVCSTEDTQLLDNVSTFSINYYANAGDTNPMSISNYNWDDNSSPQGIAVTISTSKNIAGATITQSRSLRVSSVNVR